MANSKEGEAFGDKVERFMRFSASRRGVLLFSAVGVPALGFSFIDVAKHSNEINSEVDQAFPQSSQDELRTAEKLRQELISAAQSRELTKVESIVASEEFHNAEKVSLNEQLRDELRNKLRAESAGRTDIRVFIGSFGMLLLLVPPFSVLGKMGLKNGAAKNVTDSENSTSANSDK